MTDQELAEMQALLKAARDAAQGDSNDEEIQALQAALNYAAGLLGLPVGV